MLKSAIITVLPWIYMQGLEFSILDADVCNIEIITP